MLSTGRGVEEGKQLSTNRWQPQYIKHKAAMSRDGGVIVVYLYRQNTKHRWGTSYVRTYQALQRMDKSNICMLHIAISACYLLVAHLHVYICNLRQPELCCCWNDKVLTCRIVHTSYAYNPTQGGPCQACQHWYRGCLDILHCLGKYR